MKTIKSEFIGTDATGKDFYRVIIVSESAPDSFPTSGADVDGVPDTAGIAAGSVLLTPDGNSVLYTDDFQPSGGGGGDNFKGIKSMRVSPALTYTGGETLDEYFPIIYDELPEGEGFVRIKDIGLTAAVVDDTVSYYAQITPSSDWYVFAVGEDDYVIGEKGEPVTVMGTTGRNENDDPYIVFTCAVSETNDLETLESKKTISLEVDIVGEGLE